MRNVTRRRALRGALAVGSAAVLAGCSSIASLQPGDDELPASVEEIPGVENGRIVSASDIAEAHHDIVIERSATRRGTITNSPLGDDGHGTVYTESRINDDAFFYRVRPSTNTDTVREEYIDGDDHYIAHHEDGEWTAERVGRGAGTSRTWVTGNSPLMTMTDTVRVVGTESQYGEQHYLFSRETNDESGSDETVEPVLRGHYLFTEEGLCRELTTVERDVTPGVNQVIEWSLSDIGETSVNDPEWLEQVE